MPRLHLFFPENDLALAANVDNYTPPRAARSLHIAGECLPLWYGEPGDRFICIGVNNAWYESMVSTFAIDDIDVFDHVPSADLRPAPWGWSKASRTAFLRAGYSHEMLPDDNALNVMRALSHRSTAMRLGLVLLEDENLQTALAHASLRMAQPARELEDIEMFGSLAPELCIVKAPWSSSGRGVFDISNVCNSTANKTIVDIMHTQGSVMVEEKVFDAKDFALLYTINRGHCAFVGYSRFTTDNSSHYDGNILMSDSCHRQQISTLCGGFDVEVLIESVRCALERVIGKNYDGPLGVDMAVGVDATGNKVLHASMEINLRMTMGFVAHNLAARYVHPDVLGAKSIHFRVVPLKGASAVANDYKVSEHRYVGGTLQLTPSNPYFAFLLTDIR